MSLSQDQNSLLVFGVHLKSEGYPNTLYRLRDLEASGLFQISEINVPMWSEGTQSARGLSRLTRNFWRACVAHVLVVFRYLAVTTKVERIYIPYPSVFVLLALSFLPTRFKARRVVVDVYISLYDTIVLDRALLKSDGLAARVLKWMERRAYRYADALVVDTVQNADFLSALFELPRDKFEVIPLSTNESNFSHTAYAASAEGCRVLFVGTMIPLHGISTLLEAMSLLANRSDISFKLIGDGQDSPLVAAFLQANILNLEWVRGWHSSQKLSEEIGRADICLGIFGGGGKTQRVCPLKIYAYASIGRAVITGETDWLRDASQRSGYVPFAYVPVNDAQALANKIRQLADSLELRSSFAKCGNEFYQSNLSNKIGLEMLVACLNENPNSASSKSL